MIVYYDSLKGCNDEIFLAATEHGLCFVSNDYDEMVEWLGKVGMTELTQSTQYMKDYTKEFEQYFSGVTTDFSDVKLDLRGTDFQQSVWAELLKIQYGEKCCYSDIAEALGKPSAVRAVANAIGKNPILIIVPCHRVIGKNGKLTGFRSGLTLKKELLTLENIL